MHLNINRFSFFLCLTGSFFGGLTLTQTVHHSISVLLVHHPQLTEVGHTEIEQAPNIDLYNKHTEKVMSLWLLTGNWLIREVANLKC